MAKHLYVDTYQSYKTWILFIMSDALNFFIILYYLFIYVT